MAKDVITPAMLPGFLKQKSATQAKTRRIILRIWHNNFFA